MSKTEQKLVQYIEEAHASERALARVLQAQILMTPRGRYRTSLEHHLRETREHAKRLERRLDELGETRDTLTAIVGFAENALGQVIALSKSPLDLVRGSGGEEKVLKNAKDTCASEALEIATYTALEQLARALGDELSADLAASIREQEEQMLERVLKEIPHLTDAVLDAQSGDGGSYELAETGAADALRDVGEAVKESAATVQAQTRSSARRTRKVPVKALKAQEPWPGFDELNVEEVRAVLDEGDAELASSVHTYERTHKNRAGVIDFAARERVSA